MAASEKLEGNPAPNKGSGAIKVDYKTKARMSVLYIKTTGGRYRSGTGFIVEVPTLQSPLLMTCNHIIPTRGIARNSTVYFDRENERKPGTAVKGEKLFDFSTFKISPRDMLDYTIIAMKPAHMPKPTSGEERIRFPLNAYKDLGYSRIKVGDNVYLIHYPEMEGDCVLRESAYLVEFCHGSRIQHQAETQEGSSGCPVLKEYNKEWVLVGLHRSGHDSEGKRNVKSNTAICVEAIHKDLLERSNSLGAQALTKEGAHSMESEDKIEDLEELIVSDGVTLPEPRLQNDDVQSQGQLEGNNDTLGSAKSSTVSVGLNHPPPTSTASISPKVPPTVTMSKKPPEGGVFDSKSFMKLYKNDFLKIVPAKHITLNLEIEEVIDTTLSYEMKISAPPEAVNKLFLHLCGAAKRETIAKLCKVMKENRAGYPKMWDLALAMENNEPYIPEC